MAIDYTKLLDGNSLKAIKSYIDNNFVKSNSSITGATKCKITYDSKGLVTAGANLADSDIPNLPASKITSGTFADARIASASTWNAKTKITLNGTAVTSTSIYAPTTSGTAGQYLKSNGSGKAPTWVAAPTSGGGGGGYNFTLRLLEEGASPTGVMFSVTVYKSDGTYYTTTLETFDSIIQSNVVAVKIQCTAWAAYDQVFNTVASGHVFGTIVNDSITTIWDVSSISALTTVGNKANLMLLSDCSCEITYENG